MRNLKFFNLCLLLALAPQFSHAQGIMLPIAGTVNRSMGGAGTAAPLEAMGAIYWNPATISALPDSEISFGLGLLLVDSHVASSVPGLGSGVTRGEPGVIPLPTVGWIHRPESSRLTYGLGLFAAAGEKTNFPASTTNPILTPQANAPAAPGGFGRVYSNVQYLQIIPSVSYALTEKLSIGLAPLVTLGDVMVDPLVLAGQDDADGSGRARYPTASGTRIHWGGGVQLGAYYIADDSNWRWGASLKSPQWMEKARFKTADEVGAPRTAEMDLDLPMILSLGTAYSGWQNLLWALDVRYFDYKNTDGFRQAGFRPDNSLQGLDYSSVLAVATGIQYQCSERLDLRLGYTYNQNPIADADATIAVAAPLFYQHELHVGGSLRLSETVWMNLTYTHVFPSSLTGPVVVPDGTPSGFAIPGSSVTNDLTANAVSFGVTMKH